MSTSSFLPFDISVLPTISLSTLLSSFLSYSLLSLLLYILYNLYHAYTHPLRSIPGPFFTRFTRLWLLKAIASRRFGQINIELHKKYGPVVRIAPNEYSIDDPDAANIIYRTRDQLLKVIRSYPHAAGFIR